MALIFQVYTMSIYPPPGVHQAYTRILKFVFCQQFYIANFKTKLQNSVTHVQYQTIRSRFF